MVEITDILRLFSSPQRLTGVYHQIGMEINKIYYRIKETSGIEITNEDWDNLLILDGCRYDLFKSSSIEQDGKLEAKKSQASTSRTFLQRNFVGKNHHDTVYVTANPYAHKIPEGTFHATYNLLESDWDSELQTVPPDKIREKAQMAQRKHPNKRHIIHFMQPHFPFIGEEGRKINQGGFGKIDSSQHTPSNKTIWTQLQYKLNGLGRGRVWELYQENLEIVLDEVEKLLPMLQGNTTITSDHGNLVGEWIGPFPCRGFAHPTHLHVDGLVTVPWYKIESDPRPNITSEAPIETEAVDEDVVEDRLQQLGYI